MTVGVLVVGVLIGIYIAFLTNGPTPYRVPVANAGGVDLTLQTVAAVGPQLSPNENWVSYLVRENGVWHRSTVWTLPANTLVHVTVYNFDGKSGLRNPFLAQARGVVGGTFSLNGKPLSVINPDDASHTFAIPQLGVIVPIQGVNDDAKNQCDYAPVRVEHRAHDDHVHVPHRQEGPLPLAVLRALRGRVRLRLRRPDADGGLHGRVRRCRLRTVTAAGSRRSP